MIQEGHQLWLFPASTTRSPVRLGIFITRELAEARQYFAEHDPEQRTMRGRYEIRPGKIGVCRVCGCTDRRACPDGCFWVELDLCSSCVEEAHMVDDQARFDEDDPDGPDLGPCCICGGGGAVNIIMLHRRGAIPGRGWGCVQCGLPSDGAAAVLCPACLDKYQADPAALTMACRGYPGTDGRVPIADLPEGEFDHDPAKHPELQA